MITRSHFAWILLPAVMGVGVAHATPVTRNRPGFFEARTIVSQTVNIRGRSVDISGATVQTIAQHGTPIARTQLTHAFPTPSGAGNQELISHVVKGGVVQRRATTIQFGPAGEVLARKTSREEHRTTAPDQVAHVFTTNRVASDAFGDSRNVTLTETTVRTTKR